MASSRSGWSDEDDMEVWETGHNQKKASGKESNGMRVTPNQRYCTDDEERSTVWKKHVAEEFKIIIQDRTRDIISESDCTDKWFEEGTWRC